MRQWKSPLYRLIVPGVLLLNTICSAVDIQLADGTIFKNAVIVGESPDKVFVEHDSGVTTVERHLVPAEFLDQQLTWSQNETTPVTSEPKADIPNTATEAVSEERTTPIFPPTVPATAFEEPKTVESPEFVERITVVLQALGEKNSQGNQYLLDLFDRLPPHWLIGALGGIALAIVIGSLFGALLLWLFTWIFQVRFRSYGSNYKIILYSSLINVAINFILAMEFPEIFVQPWPTLLLPYLIGTCFAIMTYPESKFRVSLAYFSLQSLGLATAFLSVSLHMTS